jgi:hypothetical protein
MSSWPALAAHEPSPEPVAAKTLDRLVNHSRVIHGRT